MVFDSPADREARMTEFESRVQHLDETEEEYMLALIKLFKAANHDVKPEDVNRAVKRKFLNGISADLQAFYLIAPDQENCDYLYTNHRAAVYC